MQVPAEVSELIANSGNNFHSKVAQWFRDNDWHVVVSPYYMDQTQSKAREIDLIVEKLYPVRDFDRVVDYVAVRLFVECKFVPTYSAFWFAEKDLESAKELVCAGGTFRADNSYTNKHHYLAYSSRVAKLFATSGSKGAETEPFYKALNQSLNAMVSMRNQSITIPKLKKSGRAPLALLEFPVVVCSSFDKLFAADFYSGSAPVRLSENFQLEVRYAYIDRQSHQRNDYFLLDFIEFAQLESFIKTIDEDGEIAAYLAGPN